MFNDLTSTKVSSLPISMKESSIALTS